VRTEIVYLDGPHYRRATEPTPEHALSTEARRGLGRLPEPVIFFPAHDEEAHDQTYINFTTGKLGKHRVPKRHVPDAARAGSCRYYFEHGVCKRVRVIPEEYVGQLDALDSQIADLEKVRREMVEDAYIRGRHLRPGDIEAATATYRAEIARLAAEKKEREDSGS
jgi:hypothetical protein